MEEGKEMGMTDTILHNNTKCKVGKYMGGREMVYNIGCCNGAVALEGTAE